MKSSIVLLLVSMLTCAEAFAQVQTLQVRKVARYAQTDETTVTPRIGASSFDALVDGPNIGGIAAPSITGPFNVAALGAQHNNGVLVYNPSDGGWRWGTSGTDYRASGQAEVDRLFPNGTYTFNVNGAAPVSVRLNGDAYANPPRVTLDGGSWSNGKYLIDPSKPMTVTTNVYAGYGSHRNDTVCVFLRGVGYTPPQILATCPGTFATASTSPAQNFVTLTIAPGSLLPGQEYTLVTSFVAVVDSVSGTAGLPGATATARYISSTAVTVKTTTPVFPMTVTTTIQNGIANSTAQIQFRPQDVGTQGSVYVFAMAPIDRVSNPVVDKSMPITWQARSNQKDTVAVQCVLAQLSATGQLNGVSASTMQAYISGVLSSQGAAITILNGVPTVNIGGATFFVGYGTSAASMLSGGINRAAVTIPGAQVCEPQGPQTGWWWNPLEDGRGFSIEKHGNNLFFASFLYDASGRSTWYVSSGPTSLEGSLYIGDLLGAHGGQTLGGAYPGFPGLANAGRLTLTFNSATNGTLVWPGGTVPIQRLPFVPNGLALEPMSNQPENGWWWNEAESGRGFFMEWQGEWLDIAGYMYDDQGNPVWYLSVDRMKGTANRSFGNTWWSFGNGQTLTGPWRHNTQTSNNVAPVTVEFAADGTALMTLPNGRTTALKRQRF